ncbi:MAG: hypothetical protein A2X28_06080 [Elusimicrobia bacterium GWA2_56_46]|jgi:hypothetical protein|nr:MAG: hypothetical protein A2X28_06080 [Elusimicrobia bacterium GWA2_56_46]OGR54600.1 MAG: hypothetical protein A2X39_02130 [Elusimicrobia bacterium GWC2_56_31]HBB67634.1 hypothetical protein [Elusimicrobiota bacterium]HBW23918.1 hypothetical protein [Elusimicrobiota bacterium]
MEDIKRIILGAALALSAASCAFASDLPEFSKLENFASAGPAAFENGARLFDGAVDRGPAPETVSAGAAGAGNVPSSKERVPAAARPLAAGVPALNGAAVPEPPMPSIEDDGRAGQALKFWQAMRKESYRAVKKGDLTTLEKVKEAVRLAGGTFFGGLLMYSNLPQVEKAAARLGRDSGLGAGIKVISADAAKLGFHSAMFVIVFLPISSIVKGVARLEPWAVGLVGLKAGRYINSYILFRSKFRIEDLDEYSSVEMIRIPK